MSESYIGPVLPPGFTMPSRKEEEEEENEESPDPAENPDSSFYGPALPPGVLGSNIIGPTLPPQFANKGGDSESAAGLSDFEDDDEAIGPMVCEAASGNDSHSVGTEQIELRAQKMKDKLLGKSLGENAPRGREEWMTELPTNLGGKIGLGARTFSRRMASTCSPEDRSAWTDTPGDKEKKMRGEKPDARQTPDTTALVEEARNRDLAKQLDKYNKSKRKESLLDMHKKKRKKNKDTTKREARKEFDRDKDLGITQMDPLKAKRVIDGARLLNGRFSHGSNHFL